MLWANEDPGAGDAETKVLVLSRSAATDIVADLEGGNQPPLTIGPMIASEDGQGTSFTVALKPGVVGEGEYKLLVGRSSSPDRITVPVAVRRKEKP